MEKTREAQHKMTKLTKNIVTASGLGDLFVLLSRLDDFFLKNTEYDKIKYWSWIHHPELARELVSHSEHDVSIFSVEDMTNYLKEIIPKEHLEKASELFIHQKVSGIGVDKYMEFISRFFPNIEQCVWLPVYKKYKTTYPFQLDVPIPKREKEYILVHPFSTTVKTEKAERTWSTVRWGRTIKMISSYCSNEDIILIGSYKDKIEGPRDFPSKRVIDLRGKTSITETIGLINGAKAVIGINSWPALMAYWNNTPTYVQWFVQQQFLDTHVPKPVDKMNHVVFEFPLKSGPQNEGAHPTVDAAWVNIRKVLDATVTI